MNFKITRIIPININGIIKDFHLNYNSSDEDISKAVEEYTLYLEDCKYYLIGNEEEEKLKKKIRKKIKEQIKLF